jgi:hypothetical protein
MERNRNWFGIIALILGGLALVVALGGRFGPRMAYNGMGGMGDYQNAAPAPPAAPAAPAVPVPPAPPAPPDARFGRGRGGPPAAFSQQAGPGAERMGRGNQGFGPGHGPMGRDFGQGRSFGHGRGFNPLGLLFGLFNTVSKLVALGLLGWLLLRLFQQRRSGPAPTTPAGHDPRVE